MEFRVWLYQDSEFTEPGSYAGFVYMITNLTNGKFYIGKKNFTFQKIKSVKGKKKRVKVPSDWADYWSSSNALQADVEALGKDKFERQILHLCENKSQMNYLELVEQVDRRVLERDDSYNEWIMVKVRKTKSLRLNVDKEEKMK